MQIFLFFSFGSFLFLPASLPDLQPVEAQTKKTIVFNTMIFNVLCERGKKDYMEDIFFLFHTIILI